ncbi:hypothetical protein JGI7_00759 [Candidatus Kryptonium thompsonii]|uniref:Outer membrane lipoprotein-sorting protein n=1 Tax=Candidatus Kryptonium thompsonii TaxID=1633631 RepID=A0A0P1LLP6_9BACT|nr:hypothetical protein [Candidatus Kryptonium thompsoni]CUS82694.1 hypothetical protein JGI12_00611 [Candidatus Kryptonium thompsoni]CUS84022.1 hypothetical protein JGI7_00759 [Candidatus Kryptonium thompsoni]CUS85257.1 hypothetical protein JGI10_01110 [Candidatus Kryptonium thompsoni]CUS88461.1 hypothetical protein JGI8_01210 [Candidatus Kryptonium thompsoni]CUS89557.1 hypothetical protein JGI13_01719 [Candidatus Kryptonium thompsoni]
MHVLIFILFINFLFAQSADEIINRAIEAVSENDKKIENLSGEFKLKVLLDYNLTVKKGNYEFLYAVKFENGMVKDRKLVATPGSVDSSSLMIAKQIEKVRSEESLKIKNLVFPFLRVRDGLSEKKINFKFNGFEKVSDKNCFVIKVDYKVKGDTTSSEGTGKIWIDQQSYLPVRCEYDVTYQSKKFGKNQSKQFLDISNFKGILLPIRNEVQVFPKILFVKFGTVKIIYETSDITFFLK